MELAHTQSRLAENERVRGLTEAVGAMNHEVNNPLAAITGNAQLLLRRADALDPVAKAKVETILESARRIQQVTGRMAQTIQTISREYEAGTPSEAPRPGPEPTDRRAA